MNTLPTFAERRRNFTQAVVDVSGTAQGPHVSIKQQRFRLIDAAGNEQLITTRDEKGRDYFEFVIVNIHTQGKVNRVFFKEKYDPANADNKPPTCFSDNGVAPSSQSQEPQSQTCAACPQAVWGSAISDAGVKKPACASVKKLAVMQPGGKMVFMFRVPPASLGKFSDYGKSVSGYTDPQTKQPMSVADVVTRVTFDPDVQGVLNFAPVAQIDPADLAVIEQLWQNPDALDDVVGNRDKPIQGTVIAPPVQQVATQIAPPPMPQQGALTAPTEKKRPGRPKKEDPQSVVPATTAPFMPQAQPTAPIPLGGQHSAGTMPEIPNFLLRQQPAQAQPAQQFGIAANAPQPNAELAQALEAALRLPT